MQFLQFPAWEQLLSPAWARLRFPAWEHLPVPCLVTFAVPAHRQQCRSRRANLNERVNDVTSPAGRDLQLAECVVHEW